MAAVALPQYKQAVLKSRVQSIYPILAALRAAEENYYLANGEYAQYLSELDISVPCRIWPGDESVALCGTDWAIDLKLAPLLQGKT